MSTTPSSMGSGSYVFYSNPWLTGGTYSILDNNISAALISPLNKSYNNTNQNFTANITNPAGLVNATFYLYNSTSLVNSTSFTSIAGSTQAMVGVVFNVVDGVYNWFYNTVGVPGTTYTGATKNFTFTKDTVNPMINFTYPSELSGSYVSRNNILVNVSVNDTNFNSTTIYLYGSSKNLLYTNFSTSNISFINYTGLSDGIYYFNATANDSALNTNSTGTVNVTIDTVLPVYTYLSPVNNTYYNSSSVFFNVSTS